MSDLRILVTGSSGFIGRALVRQLSEESGWIVRSALRSGRRESGADETVKSPGLSKGSDWRAALSGVDVVVHAAGRAHRMNDSAEDQLAAFRQVNTEGTLALARQAAKAGVRRFIFLSSIKVNGEYTRPGQPFRSADEPAPLDPYGISKLEAEEGLRDLARETGMEVTVIRPVLVYGPGVPANFRKMMAWVARGVPLPLGRVNNQRSLVSLGNLVDLIRVCLSHPAAANQTFLVSDGEDLSTPELLTRLGSVLGKPARLLPVPEKLLVGLMKLVGRGDMANRLCGSLQVDMSDTCQRLGWKPPEKLDDALRKTANDFLTRP
ncbi:MAG: SDR family oxidoreductase [Marinobacter sp.]|uniref:UDP-glucose 4-epimerase family protein n=1 Tax=Marinobacter sp. TaxID=50741 RepID=UPI00396D4E1A